MYIAFSLPFVLIGRKRDLRRKTIDGIKKKRLTCSRRREDRKRIELLLHVDPNGERETVQKGKICDDIDGGKGDRTKDTKKAKDVSEGPLAVKERTRQLKDSISTMYTRLRSGSHSLMSTIPRAL